MNETEKRDRRDEKEEIRYHVIFYGQVQGVGFRYRAYYAAYQLGLTGWVRRWRWRCRVMRRRSRR